MSYFKIIRNFNKNLITLTLFKDIKYQSKKAKGFSTAAISNEGPLKGIRVLDLSRILAGPYCTQILGDLGAEIIKVEKPKVGDDTRNWGPPWGQNDMSCYFMSINRNKKSLAIDLKKGTKVIHKLVQECDVLIENFIPGTMEKINLGYENLREINEKLIYCSITGYGQDGPYAARGGYDVIASSIGGLNHITGPQNGEPCKVGVAMTDLATGLYAYGSIVAAIMERTKTGKGQRIDLNLLSTQISCLVNIASNYLNGGVETSNRWGTAHESICPYQAFKTKDNRWITVGAGNNELFKELCDVLELPELKSDEKFVTNVLRVKYREELIEKIQDKFSQFELKEWLEKLKNCRLPFGPVNDVKSAFEDEQVKHNKMVQNINGFHLVSSPVKFSSGGNYIRSPPPTLGQHTREILKNVAKLSDNEINNLIKNSIIE